MKKGHKYKPGECKAVGRGGPQRNADIKVQALPYLIVPIALNASQLLSWVTCSQIPSFYITPLFWEIKFHFQRERQEESWLYASILWVFMSEES